MINTAPENLNIEKWSTWTGKWPEKTIDYKKISEKDSENLWDKDSEKAKEEAAKLLENLENGENTSNEEIQTPAEDWLDKQVKKQQEEYTQEQKIIEIEKIFTEFNLNPKKYSTQIKNLANRVWWIPDKETIQEIIKSSNTIANLADQWWRRWKLFKFFWFTWEKII